MTKENVLENVSRSNTRTIQLKNKEKFNGGEFDSIEIHEPRVLDLRLHMFTEEKPGIAAYNLIAACCQISTTELDRFSAVNYFLLAEKMNDFFTSFSGTKTA